MVNLDETLANGFIGLVISLAGTYVLAIWKGAEVLDAGLRQDIAVHHTTIETLRANLTEATAVPKLSEAQKLRRDHVRQVLQERNFSEDEKRFLKWLCTVGAAHPARFVGSGVSREHYSSAISKAREAGWIDDQYVRGLDLINSQIQPAILEALLAVLMERQT